MDTQLRLWDECSNNCSFCSIKNKSRISLDDKKERIKKVLELHINPQEFGIIGGEFFEGQLIGCEKEWLKMIESIKCNKLFITANLIHNQYLLYETLEANKNIIICTSYDTVGRFKTTKDRNTWLHNVKNLPNVFCTAIITEDLINDKFINEIPCGINICEPHLGIEWYKQVDKTNYHDILVKENSIFNLPKRDHFLQWIVKHPNILNIAKAYNNNHFNNIITFDKNNNIVYEFKERFKDINTVNTCGHPYFSQCYADSNRCMLCDIEEL